MLKVQTFRLILKITETIDVYFFLILNKYLIKIVKFQNRIRILFNLYCFIFFVILYNTHQILHYGIKLSKFYLQLIIAAEQDPLPISN